MLPNTMVTTLTAVPHQSGMRSCLRYSMRALGVPRAEDRFDCHAQLDEDVFGEIFLGVVPDERFVLARHVAKGERGEIRLGRHARFCDVALEHFLEWLSSSCRARQSRTSARSADTHPMRTCRSWSTRQRVARAVVQAEIENRVHHAGHARRARPSARRRAVD